MTRITPPDSDSVADPSVLAFPARVCCRVGSDGPRSLRRIRVTWSRSGPALAGPVWAAIGCIRVIRVALSVSGLPPLGPGASESRDSVGRGAGRRAGCTHRDRRDAEAARPGCPPGWSVGASHARPACKVAVIGRGPRPVRSQLSGGGGGGREGPGEWGHAPWRVYSTLQMTDRGARGSAGRCPQRRFLGTPTSHQPGYGAAADIRTRKAAQALAACWHHK